MKRHSSKWKRCVKKVKKSRAPVNPYAVCTTAVMRKRRLKNPVRDPAHKRLLRGLKHHFESDESLLARKRNPRLVILLARRPGGKLLRYVGGIKFSTKGHAVLFPSRDAAKRVGRELFKHFPSLRHYKLFVKS